MRHRQPWWPTVPVVVTLDSGAKVTVTPCARCGHPTILQRVRRAWPEARDLGRGHAARGLCMLCYHEIRYTDEWDDYAPRQWVIADLLVEVTKLRASGETFEQAAFRLGLTVRGLQTAPCRARFRY